MKKEKTSPDLNDFEVYVDKVEGDGPTYYIDGYIILRDVKLVFEGIAYGRIGGHNINANFIDTALKHLRELGLTTAEQEDLAIRLQRKLLEGQIEIRDKYPRRV